MGLRNWEIVVYALYRLGGSDRLVHTEDIALDCYKLVPQQFSWVRHEDLPDKNVARIALMDARREQSGKLVEGRSGRGKGHSNSVLSAPQTDGWKLTEVGSKWIKNNTERIEKTLRITESTSHRQEIQRKLLRIRKHPIFARFRESNADFSPDIGSIASMLRCRVDADRSVWKRRFSQYKNLASLVDQKDTLNFLTICEDVVRAEVINDD